MDTGEELRPVDASKSVEVDVVDFHNIAESFDEASDGFLEGFEEEVEAFLEESERAGKSQPVLYVDDNFYENVSDSSEVGALNGAVPVRLLPKESDLFAMLNRFSFSEGVKDVVEEDRALLVNPGGSETLQGTAYLQVGEEVAEQAYSSAVEDIDTGLDYLHNRRGVDVMELSGGRVEIQVDEGSLGREFEYEAGDSLVFDFGDESVELEYDGVRAGNQDEVYKFVVDR